MALDDRAAFLSTLPANRGEQRRALAVMLASLAIFLALAPFAKVPLAPVAAFIPAYQSALVVNDLITAVLLFSLFGSSRSKAIFALAGGYLFTGFLAVTHALTFPGLFAPGGLLGAGPQSTAWLYMFWHGGFPVFVIAYALLKNGAGEEAGRAHAIGPSAATLGVAGILALAYLLTMVATAGHDSLPAIMQGNRYTPLMIVIVSSVWLMSVAALGVLWWRRPHTVLDLWLMVVMGAWLFDIALAAVLNAGRFDLGFYAGRIYGLVAASLVLVVLLVENAKLYAQLFMAHRAALAADRAKSALLATVSHEIRTPMNGVLGMLELLALTRLDGEQRTTLQVVRESARSLLRIIDDLLDFSKIEAGKLDLRPEPASVADIVARVGNIYSGNASNKGLLLTRHVDGRIGPTVLVDPLRLGQILNNFVSNAIKFTAKGEVGLRAERVERRGGADVVRFTVHDTGIGISAADRKRLFEPFSQADDTAQRYGGTGLGLSICRRLASIMGGTIEMQSEVGVGTTMVLTLALPVIEGHTLRASGPEAANNAGETVVASRTPPGRDEAAREGTLVLLVDDHPVNRMVLAKQVNALGYAAETAENGLEALDKWSSGAFAAVITDCNMPEMNGYELARHIRACESRNGHARTPVIACTANALGGEAEACYAAGMDDYLAKPVDLAQLSQKLAHWLPIPLRGSAAPGAAGGVARFPRMATAGPIDAGVLAEIADGDPDAERELLRRFRQYNAEDANRLLSAVRQADIKGVNQTAHRIKSASRAIGAMGLALVCDRLERASREKDWQAVAANLDAFSAELERVNAASAHLEIAPALPGETGATEIAQRTFLVVEDDPFQRWLLGNKLAALGAQRIHFAAEGGAALGLLAATSPRVDIVVSDLDMPGMDGMEFIRHIGESRLPVSLILASGLDPSLVSSVEMMARAYGVNLLGAIGKPPTASKLRAAIQLHGAPRAHPAAGAVAAITVEEIARGLRNDEFEPFFQPKVRLDTREVKGAEALARWRHPHRGLVLPEDFIPQIEQAGMMEEFTESILRKSATCCRIWQDGGLDASVAVNLSFGSLADVSLADRMMRIVFSQGLEPRHVVFEVTESTAATDLAHALENLTRLRMHGFGLAIDDYGTGYSSMQQLTRVAFTELKIDRSFVTNASARSSSRAMLESSLEMASKLKIVAVAEGVEMRADWELLRELGCPLAQGYFIARPMDARQFFEWARVRRSTEGALS